MSTAAERPAPTFDPRLGEVLDVAELLHPMRHGAYRVAGSTGAAWRRAITEHNPIRFALVYLPAVITDRHTNTISLSPAHVAMAEAALCWMRPDPAFDAWVMPRGSGKTTWMFHVLPLWALAHGHRRYLVGFAATAGQAETKLAGIRRSLARNALLLADFPELARDRSPGARSTKTTLTLSGATIAAHGLGVSTLGMTDEDNTRPDLIVGTDLEPPPDKHTPAAKTRVESALVHSVLPMGDRRTAVSIEGTTTMRGSLMHDVVRAALPAEDPEHRVAEWITAHGVRPHYWPAILDEGTPRERSVWPVWRSLDELRRRKVEAPQDYALNYANRPEHAGVRGYFTRQHIRYRADRELVRRILYVDPHMTNGTRTDQTAIVLAGLDRSERIAVVEYAEAGQFAGLELRERLDWLTSQYPQTLHEWFIETNNGGDRLVELLTLDRPLPRGVTLDTDRSTGNKPSRIMVALGHMQRRAVELGRELPQLERQMDAWSPASTDDDLLDAFAGALRRLFPPLS